MTSYDKRTECPNHKMMEVVVRWEGLLQEELEVFLNDFKFHNKLL